MIALAKGEITATQGSRKLVLKTHIGMILKGDPSVRGTLTETVQSSSHDEPTYGDVVSHRWSVNLSGEGGLNGTIRGGRTDRLPTGNIVVWDGFEQTHRPTRDYTAFGPFLFDRAQYDQALDARLRTDVVEQED